MPHNNDTPTVPPASGSPSSVPPAAGSTPASTPPTQTHASAPAPESQHSHTAIYVILGIVGVLLLMCLFWAMFSFFSPRGAWSPVPGVISDYQYKQMERRVDDAKEDFNSAYDEDLESAVPDANADYITLDQAVAAARAKVGQDSVYAVEFDRVNDKAVYVIDLYSGTTLYEVAVDATTGDVLNVESAPYPNTGQ